MPFSLGSWFIFSSAFQQPEQSARVFRAGNSTQGCRMMCHSELLHPHTILQHPIPSHTILYHPIPSIPHSLLNGWFHCGSAERGYPLLFTLTPLPTCHKSRVQSNGIRGNWADRKVQTDLGKWFGLTRVLVAVYVLCTSI